MTLQILVTFMLLLMGEVLYVSPDSKCTKYRLPWAFNI